MKQEFSNEQFEELSETLAQYQTLKEMRDNSRTAWASLVNTLLRREEAAKQREVDLTVINLINKGLFTPGQLSRALNRSVEEES